MDRNRDDAPASPAADENATATNTRAFWCAERGTEQSGPAAALGAPEGVFTPMTNDQKEESPPHGSLDYYRDLGKTNPDIAVLVGTIDRMKREWVDVINLLIEKKKKYEANPTTK